ncbi:MAG TPA: universal stress protein [Thermomicrobiales bacterium]|nr:universal stress protein [Thermomicrobiales bacterium]
MSSLKTIVLAVGRPPTAWAATRAAVDLARRTGAALHVLHVGLTAPVEPWPDRTVAALASQERYDDLGRSTLAEAMRQVARCGHRNAHAHYLVGPPVTVVLHLVERLNADLLVLGGNRPPAAPCWAIGGPAIGLARHAACPTLVVRAGSGPWPPARVTLADDGRPYPLHAAEVAVRIGRLCGVDADLNLMPTTARQPVVEPCGPRRWGCAATRSVQAAMWVCRPAGAARALTPPDGATVSPPVGRPAGSTLVATARRPVRTLGDLLRWVSIGRMLQLAPGPALVVPV